MVIGLRTEGVGKIQEYLSGEGQLFDSPEYLLPDKADNASILGQQSRLS